MFMNTSSFFPKIVRPFPVKRHSIRISRHSNDSLLGSGHAKAFETLTFAPIDLNLVEPKLLIDGERTWLNDYHAEVRKKHAGKLSVNLRFDNRR